jgi:hypothetical protein
MNRMDCGRVLGIGECWRGVGEWLGRDWGVLANSHIFLRTGEPLFRLKAAVCHFRGHRRRYYLLSRAKLTLLHHIAAPRSVRMRKHHF